MRGVYVCTPSYSFMAWCLIERGDKFTYASGNTELLLNFFLFSRVCEIVIYVMEFSRKFRILSDLCLLRRGD
jgi:hypothetical protein